MGLIYDAMRAWFEGDEWSFQEAPDKGILALGFAGRHANWQCFAQAREDRDQFLFYAVAPVKASPEMRGAMAEFLTRANYGLAIGNFEMDCDDGEIRYKTSVDVEGTDDIQPLLKPCVYAGVLTADKYFPGITAVLYGQSSPKGAISAIETGTPAEEA